MTPGRRIKPGPHWWEASDHHCAIPAPLKDTISTPILLICGLPPPCISSLLLGWPLPTSNFVNMVQIWSLIFFFFFRTALHLACAQGKEDIVKFLLENNAKTNLCDNYGRTPLMKVSTVVVILQFNHWIMCTRVFICLPVIMMVYYALQNTVSVLIVQFTRSILLVTLFSWYTSIRKAYRPQG